MRPATRSDRLVTPREAADLLGLALPTIYKWAYERRIPCVKPNGPRGPLRFRLSTLEGLMAAWERPALADPFAEGRRRR